MADSKGVLVWLLACWGSKFDAKSINRLFSAQKKWSREFADMLAYHVCRGREPVSLFTLFMLRARRER
jgi:hypothetical protein